LNLKTSTPSYMVYTVWWTRAISSAGFTIVFRCTQDPVDQGGPSSCQKKLTIFTVYMFDLI
jgi:hypothetical protein